jgi:hypothetical protein
VLIQLNQTKSGCRVMETIVAEINDMKERVSTDAVKYLFRVAYLALLVSFYQLYNLGAFKTPHDWLYLQLNGGASRIKSIILHRESFQK